MVKGDRRPPLYLPSIFECGEAAASGEAINLTLLSLTQAQYVEEAGSRPDGQS
jgi:hypothetical protein